MKLRSLAFNQFKKFTCSTRLDGIGDGLNVVVGPNELGKSTLLDALRAVNMAARKVQVIILTCREQLFEELGGRQLSLKPGNAEELTSA